MHGLVDKKALSINNSLRAFCCMLPMIGAYVSGQTSMIVPMGQAGFFYATIPVAKSRVERLIGMCLMIAPGLGFYLIGGNTAQYFWFAVIYAFAVGLSCALLTNFRYLGMVALAGFVPTYTAGLNAGSSEKAAASFVAFSLALVFCGVVNMLPFWKGRRITAYAMDEADRAIMGIKLGLGMSIALGIGLFFNFGKLGWAPSAVGSVIREDSATSERKSWIRAMGVIVGAVIASIAIAQISSFSVLIFVVVLLTILNGYIAYTKLGQIPILYNAVILMLYSETSTTPSSELINTRVFYNLAGIMIALVLVFYPLPLLAPKIKRFYHELEREDKTSK